MAGRKGRIGHLVAIDDSELDQMSYARLIERSGVVDNYLGFLDAGEALKYLRSVERPPIDAILLDINMPGMDGFDFLAAATREFGDDFAETVILMLTTSLTRKDKERALSFKAVRGFCNKPLSRDFLERLAEGL